MNLRMNLRKPPNNLAHSQREGTSSVKQSREDQEDSPLHENTADTCATAQDSLNRLPQLQRRLRVPQHQGVQSLQVVLMHVRAHVSKKIEPLQAQWACREDLTIVGLLIS